MGNECGKHNSNRNAGRCVHTHTTLHENYDLGVMTKLAVHSPSSKSGFTLIEIMIVMTIIAVMSAVVVLNVGSVNYSGFMADALKIASTLEIIADEAVYTNSVIACEVNADGFNCHSYKNGDWQDLNLKKLVVWSWPENMRIKAVYVDGHQLKDSDQIRFLPSGDIEQMSFLVSDGVHNAWVDGDMSGVFVVNN